MKNNLMEKIAITVGIMFVIAIIAFIFLFKKEDNNNQEEMVLDETVNVEGKIVEKEKKVIEKEDVETEEIKKSGISENENKKEIVLDKMEYGFKEVGEFVEVPPFDIELDLSSEAVDKLKKENESILVVAYIDGKPKDNIDESKFDLDPAGNIAFNDFSVELTASEKIANFKDLKISKELYNALDDKNVHVTVNVISGRKSSDKNLLSVDIVDGVISDLANKKHVLKGDLIKK